MKSTYTFLMLFLLTRLLYGQDNSIQKIVAKNFHKINSINYNSNDDSDLDEIAKAIGDSKIVMLGEQDHGDAPSFMAKTRLIQYLHEKMGFDVLAFESDFWGLNSLWDSRENNDTFSIGQVQDNVYTVWSWCAQAQNVFHYIDSCLDTENPLIVTGFDVRHSLPFSQNLYLTSLKEFVQSDKAFQSNLEEREEFFKIAKNLITKEYDSNVGKKKKEFFISYIDNTSLKIEDIFWKQEFENLKGCALNSWYHGSIKNNIARDEYMGKNLLWLYHHKYAGKKIIVWAHNAHIAKNTQLVTKLSKLPEPYISMGNTVATVLKDSVYIMGFDSYGGKAGRTTMGLTYDVQQAMPDSFEDWVNKLHHDYGFINFRGLKINEPFYMKGLIHYYDKINWTQMYDGMFYIKNMFPCDRVN